MWLKLLSTSWVLCLFNFGQNLELLDISFMPIVIYSIFWVLRSYFLYELCRIGYNVT